jgi:hypothetical protein
MDLPAGDFELTAYPAALSAGTQLGRGRRSGLQLGEGDALRDVELRLSICGTLHGVVRRADGRPAAGAQVLLRDSSGVVPPEWPLADSAGRYECTGLASGTWTVSAVLEGETCAESSALRVLSGEKLQQDLQLRAGAHLRVDVFDRAGRPVGAGLTVKDEQGREVGISRTTEVLGETAYTVGPLPVGRYTVTAFNHDNVQVSGTVNLSVGANNSLRLQFGQ